MSLDLDAAWKIATVLFAAGGAWRELWALRKDIARIEEKQDRYNNLQARVLLVESERPKLSELKERIDRVEERQETDGRQLAVLKDSCASAHKRITEEHYPGRIR